MELRAVQRLGYLLAAVLVADLALGIYLLYRSQMRPVPRSEVERRQYAAREALRAGTGGEREWAAYAMALADAGQLGRAEEASREGLVAHEDSPVVLMALGHVLVKQGRRDEAIAVFERVVQAVEDRRAEVRSRSGAESSAYADEAVEASVAAAKLALESSSWEDAVRWLDRALDERPGMADALAMRARARAALGDAAAARRDAEAALRFVPGFPPAQEVLRSLETSR